MSAVRIGVCAYMDATLLEGADNQRNFCLNFHLTDILSQPCNFGNKLYSEGELMDRYQPTDNRHAAFCEACKKLKFDCNKKLNCHTCLKA